MKGRLPKWALWGFGALLLIAVGILIGRGTAKVEPNYPDTRDQSSSPRTRQGAVKAAEAIARIMTGPSGDEVAYREAMESVAANEWVSRAVELAENSIVFVRDRYGVGGSITFEPIRYRLTSYSEDQATVELWGVVLGFGPKIAGVEESWITGTIELAWSVNEWKASGQSSKGGPTPESLRTEDDTSANIVLREFTELGSDE